MVISLQGSLREITDFMMDAWKISFTVSLLTLLSSCTLTLQQDTMTDIINDCCGRGLSFASMGQNCSNMAGLPDVPYEDREACEAVFMSCCHYHKSSVLCQDGILHRLDEADCTAFQPDSCAYSSGKECCDCCGLGIQAYHMGIPCDQMNINTPCDHAFETCCMKTKGENDVSTPPFDPCLNNPCSQTCISQDGTFECLCTNGYELARDQVTCNDINECEAIIDPCYLGEECVNTPGSFHCRTRPQVQCQRGLRYNPLRRLCTDIDECQEGSHTCPSLQSCRNTFGSYNCITARTCERGYRLDPVTDRCIDINECYQRSDLCPQGQRCENTEGGYRCVRSIACGTGYNIQADTQECEDINECEQGLHRCQRHQRCVNEIGSHICENCPSGYRVDTRNECSIDIDECAERRDTCSRTQRCFNTQGSFVCQCIPGFEYDDIRRDCFDIDDCNPLDGSDPCLPHQLCVNLPGEYDCQNMCSYGARYRYGTCIDIDECAEGTHQCDPMQECINQEGGHICRCPRGYRLTRATGGCEDIDECTALPTSCRGSCENTDGSFRCVCPAGYVLNENGFSCNDVNECTDGTHNCDSFDEECFNTLGNYKCRSIACPEYYERRLAGNQRECVKVFELCNPNDDDCLENKTLKYSYSAISLPSIPYISSPIRLLTVEIRKSVTSQVSFRLVSGNERGYFFVQRRQVDSYRVRANVMLIQAITGPYDTDLHLEVNTYIRGELSSQTVIIIHVDISANTW